MKWTTIAALAVYLLLASLRWVLDAALPSSLPLGEESLIALLVLCTGALLFRSGAGVLPAPFAWRRGVPGALCFACAWVLSETVGGGLPALTRLALFSLVPAEVVVIAAARSASELDFLPLLRASIAGVGGMFLLLPADPETLSREPSAALAVLAVIAALGLGSYLVHPAVRELSASASTLLVLAPTAIFEFLAGLARQQPLSPPVVSDLPGVAWRIAEIALLLSLLRKVPPVPLAARFFLVPLLGAIGGFVAIRPPLAWRPLLGAALLLFGSVRLLRQRAEEPDSALSLL